MAPETKPDERRTKALMVHFTQGEWDKIDRAARLVGKSAEEWVRAAVLAAAGT